MRPFVPTASLGALAPPPKGTGEVQPSAPTVQPVALAPDPMPWIILGGLVALLLIMGRSGK